MAPVYNQFLQEAQLVCKVSTFFGNFKLKPDIISCALISALFYENFARLSLREESSACSGRGMGVRAVSSGLLRRLLRPFAPALPRLSEGGCGGVAGEDEGVDERVLSVGGAASSAGRFSCSSRASISA